MNNLSLIENKEELIIKHKSEKKESNLVANVFMIFYSIMLLITIFGSIATGDMFFLIALPFFLFSSLASLLKVKNNTILKLDKEHITIKHESSYLSSGKVTQCTFSIQDIESIYIQKVRKENIIRWFRTIKVTEYEIWADKSNGKKEQILGDEKGFFVENQADVQLIMEKMIVFWRSKKHNSKTTGVNRREIHQEATELDKTTIKDLKIGVLFDYKLDTWEVFRQVQYDWEQGNTDNLYKLRSSKNTVIFLRVCQNMAIYNAWLESRLSYHDLDKNNLDKVRQDLPLEFTFQGELFLKEDASSGYEFVEDNPAEKIKEWKYISEDKTKSLRILEHEDEDIFAFLGKKINPYEFSNILIP
jgi:hypothetical protein